MTTPTTDLLGTARTLGEELYEDLKAAQGVVTLDMADDWMADTQTVIERWPHVEAALAERDRLSEGIEALIADCMTVALDHAKRLKYDNGVYDDTAKRLRALLEDQ
jgi:aspartate/glutamate racemase